MKAPYTRSVFINCPFSADFNPIFRAFLFAVIDCEYTPRCALEIQDGAEIRLQKIERIIEQSKFGIHDLSNMTLDPSSGLPRFNMPLELGLFLGAKRFGEGAQKQKRCLILDREPHRYQAAISDISGQDVQSHGGDAIEAIKCVRNWLQSVTGRKGMPGGNHLVDRYRAYESDLPAICAPLNLDAEDLTYNDLWETMTAWQKLNLEIG